MAYENRKMEVDAEEMAIMVANSSQEAELEEYARQIK